MSSPTWRTLEGNDVHVHRMRTAAIKQTIRYLRNKELAGTLDGPWARAWRTIFRVELQRRYRKRGCDANHFR